MAGYRTTAVYLEHSGFHYSADAVHKYMNTEMGLYSLVRPKRSGYRRGKPHKVFENKLWQEFAAEKPNQKWCTDSICLFLKNHEVRHNCTILALYDRSVIVSMTDRNIIGDLAIRTLKKVEEFVYADYNHVHPHSFNGYRTPFEAQMHRN